MILVAIVGHVNIDETASRAWRALRLDAGDDLEWPEGAPIFTGERPLERATVGEVLDAVAMLTGCPDFFDFDGRRVRGLLLPDATVAFHQDLATSFRLLERVGGRGELAWFVPEERVALAMRLGDDEDGDVHEHGCGHGQAGCGEHGEHDCGQGEHGCGEHGEHGCGEHGCGHGGCGRRPKLAWVSAEELLQKDERIALGFMSIMSFYGAARTEPSLSYSTFREARTGLGLRPLAEQPHHRDLLERLQRVSPELLQDLLRKSDLRDEEHCPLEERYPSPGTLADGLRRPDPILRAAAPALLSLCVPDQLEQAVVAWLDDPSVMARAYAITALGNIGTDGALERLLALDPDDDRGDPMYSIRIRRAVSASRAPGRCQQLLGLSSDPRLAPATFEGRKRGTAERRQLVTRAEHQVFLLAIEPSSAIDAVLIRLFEDHPAEELRLAAAQALVQRGAAELDAHTDALGCTLMGMGRALNLDDAGRRRILGVLEREYESGYLRFEGVSLAVLQSLVREHFAHPETAQNDSPTIGQFLEFLEEHPELEVGGYLIGPERPDYRVSIDTLVCRDLARIPEERREAVEELFETLSESASNVEMDGQGYQSCHFA